MVDIAIIGGGIVGIFSALTLAEMGYSVTLIEANELGSGLTSLAAGIFSVQLPLKMDYKLVKRSLVIIERLERYYNKKSFSKTGLVTITKDNEYGEKLVRSLRKITDVEILDNNFVRRKWPDLIISDNEIVLLTNDDGVLDIGTLINTARTKLKELNVEVLEHVVVKEVSRSNVVLLRNGMTLKPDIAIIVAAGPYTPNLLKQFRDQLPSIYHYRCQVHSLIFNDHIKVPTLMWDLNNYFFLLLEQERRAIIGNGILEIIHEINEGYQTSEAIRNDVIIGLLNRIPKGENSLLSNEWSAPCDVSCDGLPIVGRIEGTNIVVAYGLNGYGLMRGPAIGEIAAYLALGKKHELMSELFKPSTKRPVLNCIVELFNPVCC